MAESWKKYSPGLRERRKDYMKKAGSVLKSLRKKVHFTQTQVGNLVEVSRQEISAYESGSVDMPYSTLPVLIEDLDASTYDVMRGLLPNAQHEFELCRDILMDLISKSGMDTSVMDPFYPSGNTTFFEKPKNDLYHSYLSLRKKSSSDERRALVLHDDPVMSVLDCVNLVAYYAPEDDANVKRILFKSIRRYWEGNDIRQSNQSRGNNYRQ